MTGIACSRTNDHGAARKPVQKARRGAPPGNSRRLVHGRYARATLENRRARIAAVKLASHIVHALGMVQGRNRIRVLRTDQVEILAALDPDLLALARCAGVRHPGL